MTLDNTSRLRSLLYLWAAYEDRLGDGIGVALPARFYEPSGKDFRMSYDDARVYLPRGHAALCRHFDAIEEHGMFRRVGKRHGVMHWSMEGAAQAEFLAWAESYIRALPECQSVPALGDGPLLTSGPARRINPSPYGVTVGDVERFSLMTSSERIQKAGVVHHAQLLTFVGSLPHSTAATHAVMPRIELARDLTTGKAVVPVSDLKRWSGRSARGVHQWLQGLKLQGVLHYNSQRHVLTFHYTALGGALLESHIRSN